eukprot:TRINITY_DN7126_c0_g1_i1.p1 TRINITY_DN7126_c0_g1~~TRINITY_DN7126_c0_g1_i1.p1  ORF type:complete len:517 (-),score=68.23 TRINITY_DN7126_c0_g1_i1:42-1592(-)
MKNSIMQLRKVCNHPFLFFDELGYDPSTLTKDELIRSAGKMELLDRLLPKLHRCKHRVLLFSQMTRLLDLMEDYLQYRHYAYLRLDGSTKSEHRGQLLQQFNDPNSPYFVFILSTRSGGLGLNLQSADTVIIFDSDWNPQMDIQAQDRAHRIGQKSEVRVFRLCTLSPVEEHILNRAQFKLEMDHLIIQAGKFNKEKSHSSDDKRKDLQDLVKLGLQSNTHLLAPSDTQINQMLCRSEEEFELFEMMDQERDAAELQLWKQQQQGSQGSAKKRKSAVVDESNYTPRPRLMQRHEIPQFFMCVGANPADNLQASDTPAARKAKPQQSLNEDLDQMDILLDSDDSSDMDVVPIPAPAPRHSSPSSSPTPIELEQREILSSSGSPSRLLTLRIPRSRLPRTHRLYRPHSDKLILKIQSTPKVTLAKSKRTHSQKETPKESPKERKEASMDGEGDDREAEDDTTDRETSIPPSNQFDAYFAALPQLPRKVRQPPKKRGRPRKNTNVAASSQDQDESENID